MDETKPEVIIIFLLCLALVVAAVYDLKYQKIPNLLNFSLAASALAFYTIFSGLEGLWFSLTGLLVGTALFLPPYLVGGMGAGDAKLMGAAGAVLGAKGVFISALLTALFGGLYALLVLILHRGYARELFRRTWAVLKTFILTRQYVPVAEPNPVQNKPRLCYGLAIALGVFTYLIYGGLDLI